MVSVYLTAGVNGQSNAWISYPKDRLIRSAVRDRHGVHTVVNDPTEADLIILASNFSYNPSGLSLLRDSLARKHYDRLFVYSSADTPSPLWRGLFPSWPRSQKGCNFAAGWCYFHPNAAEDFIDTSITYDKPNHLWSFVGSAYTHPVRGKILSIRDDRAHLLDTSASAQNHLKGDTGEQAHGFRDDYIQTLSQSKFVVCPRGVGNSSMRIFEAMKVGRVPVIVADNWLKPPFIEWDSCAIHLSLDKVQHLPEIMRDREAESEEMGATAKREWCRVFKDEGMFHHAVEACLEIQKQTNRHLLLRHLCRSLQLIRSPHSRDLLRWLRKNNLS